MTTDRLNSALNECVEDAVAIGDFETAQNICDAHAGDIAPDLFWTVEAHVADFQDGLVEESDESGPADDPPPVHERFDLTDAEEAA